MTKEQITMNETSTDTDQQRTCETCNMADQGGYLSCEYVCAYKVKKLKDDLACKTQECEELKTENEELNDRMAEVTFRATGGRLSYSNYTLDAIEKAFNDQLEILSDQKVEEETKELEKEIEILKKEICNTRVGVYGDIQPTVFGKSLDEIHKILTEADRYRKALEAFQDDYFKGLDTTTIAELAKKSIRLTTENRKLEQECEELKEKFKQFFGIDNQECWDIAFLKDENARYRKTLEEIEEVINGYINKNELYNRRLNKILDIISKAKEEE